MKGTKSRRTPFTVPVIVLSHSHVATSLLNVDRRPKLLAESAETPQLSWVALPSISYLTLPSYDSNIAILVVNRLPRGGGKCV
jgi:hypothetical protein